VASPAAAVPRPLPATSSIDQLCIDTIRTLAMDAVQKADSGHPGTPMALAPLAYSLFTKHMRHNPADPHWANRDRFVLSCGHASMLLYSSLYLTGYDLTLDDLKQFRQWESRTPGHPEYGYTAGVETTTGPLGQGMGNAVGMAVAEAHLAAKFNREGHAVVDHYTYFICSDGDMMEGISHEVSSFAGHFGLGKLIGFYDDNHITIDGSTDLTFTDDTGKRFEAYGWHVLHLPDINDLSAIDAVIAAAKKVTDRPTMVVMRTHIGYGSPNRVDSSKAHGEPLGVEEIKLTKENLGWPSQEPFFVPPEALAHCRTTREKGAALQATWQNAFADYRSVFPADAAELDRRLAGKLPDGWEKALPGFTAENGAVASRAASGVVLNALAAVVPELMGGSADLAPSNNTMLKNIDTFTAGTPGGRNMHFGIREHGMTSIMNGMSLHGGVIPYGGTFLVFSDYMRPAVRLAAFMKRRVVYVFTHDSIGLGEDGPTHQPVEQLTALRVIPRLTDIRPADAGETVEAWRSALLNDAGPTALVLTRQKLGFIDRAKYAPASGLLKGAYVLGDAKGGKPDVVIMSTGSEVAIAIAAYEKLTAQGIAARVVSMPSHALFARQPLSYRDSVLVPGAKKVAIEAAHPMSWYRWVGGDGEIIGIDHFGASAPYQRIYEALGLTVDKVVAAAKGLLGK